MTSAEQIPVPCRTCGAPMHEANAEALYGQVQMVCAHCGATEALPVEPAERVRALRQRLAQIRWAAQAAEGPAIAMTRAIESYRSMVTPMIVLLVGIQVFCALMQVPMLLSSGSRQGFGQLLVSPLITFAIAGSLQLGTYFALRAYARDLQPAMLAFVPSAPGLCPRCRSCGGDLPATSQRAFLTCLYCSAPNLVTPELAARHAKDLDRELAAQRARASDVGARIQTAYASCRRRMYVGVGAGVAMAWGLSGAGYGLAMMFS